MHKFFFLMLILMSQLTVANESICYGETKNGKLEAGVKLPEKGINFISYSTLAGMLGRTYVHSKVRSVFLEAYKNLALNRPEKVFKYAETGFKEGGEFKPHKTHQNGLSIDFMVPVINEKGKSVYFSSNVLNKFGYSVEFSKKGEFKEYRIDFESLAAHIVELDKTAKKHGFSIWRVIFDPTLQDRLFKTKFAGYLRKNIRFSKTPAWVRHDEHYHVDFKLSCKKM